jgi:integrase
MKYNCTFYLDKEKNGFSPINACITYSSNRLRYFTGYRIDKKNFKIEFDEFGKNAFVVKNAIGMYGTNRIKYNDINEKIKAIEVRLHDFLDPLKETPEKQSIIEQLNDVCKKVKSDKQEPIIQETFWQVIKRYLNSTDVSDTNQKQIKSSLNHFKTFIDNENVTFEDINGNIISEFETWLKNGGRGRNSVSVALKRLKRFFSWAITDQKKRCINVTIKNPFNDFEITPELYGEPILLTKKERDLLFNLSIENDRLKKVRDIFLFQCFCGARISDLMSLKRKNLQDGILSYIPQKTSKETMKTVEIPLNDKAIEILQSYNEADGYLLPRMSDVEINRTLKTLFISANLNRSVEYLNSKTGVKEFKPLHELATTHLARRTFAGLLYNNGVKDGIIASMTGHSEHSKAFVRYRKIDIDLKKQATKNL